MSGVKKTIDENRVILENRLTHDAEAEIYDVLNYCVKLALPNKYVNEELGRIVECLRYSGKVQYNVLDIGCGTGYITEKIYKNKQFKIDAVDISAKMLEQLKAKINSAENVRTYQKEASEFVEMAGGGETYDLIIFSGVLHHLFDYLKVLEMSVVLLSRGGYIYILNEPFKKLNLLDFANKFMHRLLRLRENMLHAAYYILFKKSLGSYNKAIAEYHTIFHGGINLDKILCVLKQYNVEIISDRRYILADFNSTYIIAQKLKCFRNCVSIIGQKV